MNKFLYRSKYVILSNGDCTQEAPFDVYLEQSGFVPKVGIILRTDAGVANSKWSWNLHVRFVKFFILLIKEIIFIVKCSFQLTSGIEQQ